MAITVRELVTKWGFDVDDAPLKKMEMGIGVLTGLLAALGATISTTAFALYEIAHTTAEFGNDAVKTAQRLGIGVEALQGLQYAGQLAQISTEEFNHGLMRFNRLVFDAAIGSQQAQQQLNMIGVSARGANGKIKPVDELMGELADKFSAMPDDQRKTAIAMDLFGRSGSNLIPLLNKGRSGLAAFTQEAQDMGLILTEKVAKQGEEFEDSFIRFWGWIRGIKNEIGAELIPVITEIVQGMSAWLKANRAVIVDELRSAVASIGYFLERSWHYTERFLKTVSGLTRAFGGLNNILKVTAWTVGIIAGISGLWAIGMVTMAMPALIAETWEWVEALGVADIELGMIPVVVGAIVVAFGLLIEDIVAFFQGRNSVVGLVLPWLSEQFSTFMNWLAAKMGGLSTWLAGVTMTAFQPFLDFLNGIAPALEGWVRSFGNLITAAFSPLTAVMDFIKSHQGGITDSIASGINGAMNMIGLGAGTVSGPALSAGVAGGSGSSTISVAPVFNITAGDNASAEDIASKVRDVHRDELSRILGPTLRASDRQDAY